jgi:hypothetical protein
MREEYREPFCDNTDCKFHKYSVYVGVKCLEYVDPIQFGETRIMQNSDASPVNDFYHVSHIKRDWIYKGGIPLGKFCNRCARELLGLPREKDSDK